MSWRLSLKCDMRVISLAGKGLSKRIYLEAEILSVNS